MMQQYEIFKQINPIFQLKDNHKHSEAHSQIRRLRVNSQNNYSKMLLYKHKLNSIHSARKLPHLIKISNIDDTCVRKNKSCLGLHVGDLLNSTEEIKKSQIKLSDYIESERHKLLNTEELPKIANKKSCANYKGLIDKAITVISNYSSQAHTSFHNSRILD